MASFANSLRHLLGRGQPPRSSTSTSIARFDGASDGHTESQQMCQSAAAGQNGALHPTVPLQTQYMQPRALQQREDGCESVSGLRSTAQVPNHADRSQSGEISLQLPPRKTTAQSAFRTHLDEHSPAMGSADPSLNARAEVEVKQEPAGHEQDDDHLFAEFTNEELYDDDKPTSEEDRQPAKSADHAVADTVSVKREPRCESQLPLTVTGRAGPVESVTKNDHSAVGTPNTMAEQMREVPSLINPSVNLKDGASASGVRSEPEPAQSYTSFSRPMHTDGFQQQYSFEQYAHNPSASRPEAEPGTAQNVRSPSADSVIDAQRLGSEQTSSPLGGMDLAANVRLLEQQWKDRYKLSGLGPLTAEAVQANPALLHGPGPSQEQRGERLPSSRLVNQQAPSPSVCHAQPTHGLQHHSTFPYNLDVQYLTQPMAAQSSQVYPHWMPSGSHSALSMHPNPLPDIQSKQDQLLQGSMSSHRITEKQDHQIHEGFDDGEPLANRTIRHRSTTASPTASIVQETTRSSVPVDFATAASKPSIPNPELSSVIEVSDNDDETTEPISWKLPDFEVTYHPPATDKDLPMAKVSVLGRSHNLVRSEVALTEDHAHQEMELFLNVFLPAQQALQTPDPEPAHAVINFHTISVMVLEAFVQYEIGDEMGRGYGFHGGNIGNQALRPSAPHPDSEPARTRSAKDADVDEIFFAVIDRWRAGLISGKGTLKLIRGCQEFCDIALDIIHYVKEHGVSQPEPRKRKERCDKGVKRGSKGGEKQPTTKPKVPGKRKADAVENKALAKKGGKVNELSARKKVKTETKKKPKPKVKSSGITILKGNK